MIKKLHYKKQGLFFQKWFDRLNNKKINTNQGLLTIKENLQENILSVQDWFKKPSKFKLVNFFLQEEIFV